jgi:hypothetical protein
MQRHTRRSSSAFCFCVFARRLGVVCLTTLPSRRPKNTTTPITQKGRTPEVIPGAQGWNPLVASESEVVLRADR